jgi:glycosyltransferase involved in cell wall biosynthesis
MRIAQVSTVGSPVRPFGTGSVEGLVWLLTRELAALGHEVTVFGVAGSVADGQVVETLPGAYGRDGAPDDWLLCEWLNLCAATARAGDFDVIHAHGYLLGVPLQALVNTPMLHTLHVMPGADQQKLAAMAGRRSVTALSEYQWRAYPDEAPALVVPHGADPCSFPAGPGGDYLCYLGRFLPSKGPVEAIAAARECDLPIVLAGPENDYFREHVAGHVDGVRVRYAGSVTADARRDLLRHAAALLYPPTQGEPFGLVMIEALMCGTPVAALRTGAVEEVLEPGLTGALAKCPAELAAAVRNAARLDRRAVRSRAVERFHAGRMALGYLDAYSRLGVAP